MAHMGGSNFIANKSQTDHEWFKQLFNDKSRSSFYSN